MVSEQEIALQRIKDPSYFRYEGTESDIALLHSLLENVAKSEKGAKIISGFKKNKELPENHRLTIKIQNSQLIGITPADGVHCDNGDIILFKRGGKETDEKILQRWIDTLTHELCHEEQFQKGLIEYSNFTPEQNFIINRLKELDAKDVGKQGSDFVKEHFEGSWKTSWWTDRYNFQALNASLEEINNREISDKSFEEIRSIYIKRLGVDINPEYFSTQTLVNSYSGKNYFLSDGKLPIKQETSQISSGEILNLKHPRCELMYYTPKEGNIRIKAQTTERRKSIIFYDNKSDKQLLAIEQIDNNITEVQTIQHPSECRDLKDFDQTISQMPLSKDVLEVFHLDLPKIKKFIVSPQRLNSLGNFSAKSGLKVNYFTAKAPDREPD